jgi:lycopene beta-cyclase
VRPFAVAWRRLVPTGDRAAGRAATLPVRGRLASVGNAEYLILLGLCLLVTAPLEPLFGFRVYRRPLRLARTLACVGAVFVTWDLVGARLGHWDYNPNRISGVSLFGLPVEEYLFCVVVPLCGILAYEAVRASLDDVTAWLRRRRGR